MPDTIDTLAPLTRMGAVELHVRDMDTMLTFYRDVLALDELPSEGAESFRLGRYGVPSVTLTHTPDLPEFNRSGAGLFHTAVLFETREALAAAVARAAQSGLARYTGSADHLVSIAFYFDDPEGNGVELYWDRAKEDWPRGADGRPLMDTLAIDANGFLETHLTEQEVSSPLGVASVGHVHLQVGDIATARDFYVGTVGFQEIFDLGSALFVSAGGYHHHVGLNIWNSRGAGPRAASLGLGRMDIVLPDADGLGALRERVTSRGIALQDDGRTLTFPDPWGSKVHVSVGTD